MVLDLAGRPQGLPRLGAHRIVIGSPGRGSGDGRRHLLDRRGWAIDALLGQIGLRHGRRAAELTLGLVQQS